MSHIAIVTDSSAYLPAELAADYGVYVIPLNINFEGETFRDGVDLTPAGFYERLKRAKTLPTTSQPSTGDFIDLYRRLGRQADAIISIHISGNLSGTVQSALAARQTLQAEAAERGDPQPEIHVVDSLLTSGGLGLLVTAAARMARTTQPAAEVVQALEELIPEIMVVFVTDTLEYLQKGGRIGGALALLGSMIQIKPILYLDGGQIKVLEKARTSKKAKLRLLEILQERTGKDAPLNAAIFHANSPDEAEKLKMTVANRYNCTELFCCELSAVIATHVGPGTLAVAFYQ